MNVGEKVKVEFEGIIISSELDQGDNKVYHKVRPTNSKFGYAVVGEEFIQEGSVLTDGNL